MLEIDVAGLGQSELAGCAVQQLCAQSLFQLMHLAADRGLGQVQRAGSGSEAAQLDNLDEHQGVIEITAHEASRRFSRWRDSYRSEEHTSELQSLMRNSYAVFCLKKNTQ